MLKRLRYLLGKKLHSLSAVMAGKWNLENGMYAYLQSIHLICYAVHLFLIYLPFCLFICRLHYWEEALLPRDPRWWKAWALLFVLVHIWWDNAPYLFGWVKHNLCCSEGWWLVTGLAQGIGFLSTIGMFWIVWDGDTICMFSTVAINVLFVDLRLFLNAILVIYIFVRF